MARGSHSRKKTEMIAAIIGARTLADASVKCGVPVRTLYRYLSKPDFARELNDAKSQMLNSAIDKMAEASFEAVEGLIAIGKDGDATSSARVTAWRSIIELAIRGNENRQIIEKLEELEKNNSSESTSGWIHE